MRKRGRSLGLSLEKSDELAKRLNFFDQLKDHQRQKILRELESSAYAFSEGDTIIKEGDKQDYALYILLSGTVHIQKGANADVCVAEVLSGDFFGEVSFIMRTPRMATVKAADECIVLRLNQENFHRLELPIQIAIKDKIILRLIMRLNKMNKEVFNLHSDLAYL